MKILINKYYKFFDQKKYFEIKNLNREKKRQEFLKKFFYKKIKKLRNLKKKNINFLHSGQLGDIICSLPVIYHLSKKHSCNLYLNIEKKNSFLNFEIYKKLLPLLKKQPYINNIDIYKNQSIDINFDLFREFPFLWFNLNKIFLQLTGLNFDLNKKFIFVKKIKKFSNKIIILRSLRRKNLSLRYNFLNRKKNLIFIGLKDEFFNLKKKIPNLKYYNCKDFLEMSILINSSKLFIGNNSFGFHLAEGLKVKRILEKSSEGPDVIPFGSDGYEVFFQCDFEKISNYLLKKK